VLSLSDEARGGGENGTFGGENGNSEDEPIRGGWEPSFEGNINEDGEGDTRVLVLSMSS